MTTGKHSSEGKENDRYSSSSSSFPPSLVPPTNPTPSPPTLLLSFSSTFRTSESVIYGSLFFPIDLEGGNTVRRRERACLSLSLSVKANRSRWNVPINRSMCVTLFLFFHCPSLFDVYIFLLRFLPRTVSSKKKRKEKTKTFEQNLHDRATPLIIFQFTQHTFVRFNNAHPYVRVYWVVLTRTFKKVCDNLLYSYNSR